LAERPVGKLTVIVHADVVGSTVLVQHDERRAHERITGAFERLSQTIHEYGGQVHEIRGDALVAEFARASDALCAAITFQQCNTAHNKTLDDEIIPEVRMGISLGEVIVADNTVTGAGVVLAQRVEQLANSGGVCVTEAIREATPGRLPLDIQNLGEQTLKGFEQPVLVHAVRLQPDAAVPSPEPRKTPNRQRSRIVAATVAAAVVVATVVVWLQAWQRETEPASVDRLTQSLPDKPSIAVLPFDNLSNDPEQDYFVDGIAEDLITDLSKVSGLLVVARNSSFNYRGQSPDIREVGQALNVRYVLEGSVRKAGGNLRINAQLIDADSGHHLWAERYDREVEGVFSVQDDVTRKIVAALSVALTSEEEKQVLRPVTDNLEAYDVFLRGQSAFRALTEADNERSQELYKRAVQLDPSFARAYGALAVSHVLDFRRGWSIDRITSIDRAMELARKGVELDNASPEVLWSLGLVYLFKRQYEQATQALERAIHLAPSYADGYGLLALINNVRGTPADAIRLVKQAMKLNPHYTFEYPYNLGRAYYSMGRYSDAATALREATERNEAAIIPRIVLAASYVRLGQMDEAEWEITQVEVIDPNYTISKFTDDAPLSHMEDEGVKRLIEDIRKAGLPE
jgi:adenylate cyclase